MPRAATSSRMRGLVSASRSAAQAYCQSPAGCMSSSPGWHMSSTVRPDGKPGEHGREIGLVEPAAEVEAYEIVAAPQALQRRRRAEEVERRLLRDAPRVPQAAQHVAAHALGRIADGARSPCSAASSATMPAMPGSTCTCWCPSMWLTAMPASRTRRSCASSSRRTSAQRDPAAQPLAEQLLQVRRETAVGPDEARGSRGADRAAGAP